MISRLTILLALLGTATCFGGTNSPAPRPNILFAIADDMGHASAYGTRLVKTPNFDRLADRGILFLNAYTPDAKCAPSRACIMTGRNPWQLEEAANHWCYYPAKYKSWMEALSDGGYFVGSTGKTWGPGVLPAERKNLAGKGYHKRKLQKPTSGISDANYVGNFEDFLDDRPEGKPFCFWFGAFEPHRPYQKGSGQKLGHYKLDDASPVPSYWPDEEPVRGDMLDYAFEVGYFDAQLGKMVELLKEKGLLENTIIIATSDNGPPFPRMKGHPFESSCHLPLAIHWPKGIKSPGRTCDALVSFIDFAPTLLEVAGVNPIEMGMQPVTGKSLTDLFASKKSKIDRSLLLMGRERNDTRIRPGTESGLGYPVRSLRQGDLLYLHNFEPDRWPCGNPELGLADTDNSPTKSAVEAKGESSTYWQLCFGKRPSDELYNIKTDRDCTNNLAGNPKYRKQLEAMREKLFAQLRGQNDPRLFGKGDIFDRYPSASPKAKSRARAH